MVREASSVSNRNEPDPATLIILLTPERMASYLDAVSGDARRAVALYDWNTTASASVLATTAMVEVIVRNALDRSLTAWARRKGGPDCSWLDVAPLDAQGRADVAKARVRATRAGRDPEKHGKVVAELSFGFWRYLVATRYLTALWIPGLHRAFPYGERDLRGRRQAVERALQNLLLVRNRAAHHEPIHRRDLARDLRDAIQIVGWVDVTAAVWVETRSSLVHVVRQRGLL